jgi:hypothetical protein
LQQVGDASIDFSGVSPDPTVAGQNADFAFTLHSDALLPATLTLTASLLGAAGTPLGWTTSILDATFNALTNNKITVAPGDTKPFYVRVAIPNGSGGTPFMLKADGTGGGLTASSGAQNLKVGDTATPDSAIPDLSPITVKNGSISGSTVTVTSGLVAELDVEAHFTVAPATYNVQVAPAVGTTDWAAQLLVPPSSFPAFDVATVDLTEAGPPPYAKEIIKVQIAALVGSPAKGSAVLTVQRLGQTTKRTFSFDVVSGPGV